MQNGFWRRLLHRWLIEYNPLYLLSAALVLAGTNLLSRGFASEGSLYQMLGGAAVAELYAWTLIGGAALLMRIRLTRPAVMLALLAALYQCDVTLHTETCVYLGWLGAFGSLLWVASFVAKLHALAWAMKLRVARSAFLLPSVGAIGFALLPRAFLYPNERLTTELVGLWAFGLFAAGLWSQRRVTSHHELGEWGRTVLRRSLLAVWTLWSAFAVLHFVVWSRYESLELGVLVPAGMLCLTRWLRSEGAVWCALLGTLGFTAVYTPQFFAVAALMAAATLVLRAMREPRLEFAPLQVSHGPYRAAWHGPPAYVPPTLVFVRGDRDALHRLFGGVLFCVYLSIWTHGWSRGPWPDHVIALDVALGVIVIAFAWRTRAWGALAPLAVSYVHFVLVNRLIPAPTSVLEWGAACAGGGFVLLVGSLAFSWFARGWRCQPMVGGEPDG